ncbi:MAG: hypothetical protein IPJ51_23890 [Saprospiraceae bacterium]|nr:hypothetical protein [Saprospiraceae bacterium]
MTNKKYITAIGIFAINNSRDFAISSIESILMQAIPIKIKNMIKFAMIATIT